MNLSVLILGFKMKISVKSLIAFILIAIFSLWLWYKLGYSRLLFVDLSVDKKEALAKAESYLVSLGADLKGYHKAIVFHSDGWADRYLQKILGVKKEEEFLKQHNYNLFYWNIRFFKESQKEEYRVTISPKTAEMLSFEHSIEDIARRDDINKEFARRKAEEFLKSAYKINLDEYAFHAENAKRYDFRTDYTFSWEKKNVYIPWEKTEGGAKLLISITLAGSEIRSFNKNWLDIPEKFKRYIQNRLALGEYLSSFSFLLIAALVIFSICTVVKKKHTVTAKISRKLYINLAAVLIVLNILAVANEFQRLVIGYPTTVTMSAYFWLSIMRMFLSIGFGGVMFVFPGMAGELLRAEQLRDVKYSSLLYYVKTTFFSRNISWAIFFGYLLFFTLLGFQAVLFYLGQEYLGVWKELTSLSQFSSSYLPFFGAFVIGLNASLDEEIIFRLFGISFSKRFLKSTTLAVIFSSLVWGFGHTSYAIFPVWFRGIEVSLLGILFGFAFIKYGFITVVVAHYLFDVFWGTATYIFGHSSAYLFFSSLAILSIPLIFAAAAFFVNKEDREKEIRIRLDKIQKYNLGVLIVFVSAQKNQGVEAEIIKKELLSHNWDIDLVDLAIEEVFKAQ